MTAKLFRPANLETACALLAEQDGARPLAGGTDIFSARERGTALPPALVALEGLGLEGMHGDPSGGIRIGSLVTHAAAARSPFLAAVAPVLAEACAVIGSPQVRNRGTLGGNLCNASPAADAAAALLALGARLEISGPGAKRFLPVEDFFLDYGRTALLQGEIVSAIIIPSRARHSAYLKLGRRRALEIALVGVAAVLEMEEGMIKGCRIGLAAAAPVPFRARRAEAALTGVELTEGSVERAARIAAEECNPISDHRASAAYRRDMVRVLFRRAVLAAAGQKGIMENGVILDSPSIIEEKTGPLTAGGRAGLQLVAGITFLVNGQTRRLETARGDKLLVDVLREDFGLTGTKKVCGEGECGACTVLLDGLPVNSCLVPAAVLEGREIVTVEGLADKDGLNPLQSAFVREGAIQCGYCTPGMIISASALLKEDPFAGEERIKEALSGNICRCTGYKKIIQAVQKAGAKPAIPKPDGD